MKPFFISVPHAGETVPPEASWLKDLPETILMCDVDRYVHELYGPACKKLGIPILVMNIHRYVVDPNRLPEDIDCDAVKGSENPSGKFTTGFHWSKTMTGEVLMKEPMSLDLHKTLTQKYFVPFQRQIEQKFADFRAQGHKKIYHLDAHSMPSQGTAMHRDPGGQRPQIVVSDKDGVSCESWYKDLVIETYKSLGFEVAYNWPYKGGRITETYGQPSRGQHTLQVEMNRSLYMNEKNKKKDLQLFSEIEKRVAQAVQRISSEMPA